MDTPETTGPIEMERRSEPVTLTPFELNASSWPAAHVDLDMTPTLQKVPHPAEQDASGSSPDAEVEPEVEPEASSDSSDEEPETTPPPF